MSGFRNKKPDDIIKNRQEYLNNLAETIQLQDANEQAVRLYKETGQMPPQTQMKDNRTLEDKLRDVEKLKQSIREDLSPICDQQFANQIIQSLIQSPLNTNNELLIFLAQRCPDIVNNLKKTYKFGIKGDGNDAEQFVNFVFKFYNEKNTLVQNTKSFMNRVGVNTSLGLAKKMEQQNTLLTRLEAEIYSLSRRVLQFLNKYPLAQYNRYKARMEDINNSIFSLISNYNYIYPKNPIVFEQIEKLLVELEGTGAYQAEADKIARYMDYINHNLPNTDFFGSLITDLDRQSKSIKRITDITANFNPTIETELNKFTDILENIYNQLDTGEKKADLIQVRRDFDDIVYLINQEGVNTLSQVQPKEIGQPIQYIPAGEVMHEPEIPEDFGKKQRDYLEIDEWPPSFPNTAHGMTRYIVNFIKPLLDIVPDNNVYFRADQEITQARQALDKNRLVEIKKALKEYLKAHKISLKHVKPWPVGADSGTMPVFNVGDAEYNPPQPRGFGIAGTGLTRPVYNFTKKSQIDPYQGTSEEPRYIKFGRYLVNTKKLKDNIISLRRGTGTQIASLPAYKMSSNLGKVIKKITGGGLPNGDDFKDLTDEEKTYLIKLSREADLSSKIEIPAPSKDEEEKDIHQFNVLKGEIMAGNDSKEAIKKFKLLLVKLSNKRILDKKDVADILETLAELGH